MWCLVLLALSTLDCQLSIAYAQSLVTTNWNDLVTNWVKTSAPNTNWYSIASSSDGTKLAAVAGGGGIWTSTNAGMTWTQTGAPNTNWSSIASSSDGTQLAAVVNGGGIYTSTDAGVTWTQTGAPSTNWSSIASSSDGNHLAAVVFYPAGGIYNSTDAGVTWTQSSAPSEYWHSIASSSDGTQLAAVVYFGGGIYTSTNAGVTWTHTSAPNTHWTSIASSSDGTNLAAVVAAGGGIYASTNAGATWTRTSAPPGGSPAGGPPGWWSIASSSDGRDLAAVLNGGGIYTSTNAGVTWTQTSATGQAWYSIASSADGTKLAAVVHGGGIYTAQATIQTNTGLTNIVITPAYPVVAAGSNVTFTATGYFTNGFANLTTANGLAWSSSGPTMASIDSNGLAIGLTAGTSIISATWSNFTGDTVLTVEVPTNIIITPANPVIGVGSNVSFTATGYFTSFDAKLTSGNGLVWSSSDPTVASIDTNGLAIGLSVGTTTISATWSNVIGDTVLLVVPPPVILTNPVSATVSPGGSVTLSVSASSSDLSYQWSLNGAIVTGATNATLVITNVSSANVGSYAVIVSNPAGSVTCQAASVASLRSELYQGGTTNWNTLSSWTPTSAPNREWKCIASSSDGTKLAAVDEYPGGIWTSTNAGMTWTQTIAGETWYSIASSSDGSKLAAVASNGGIWTSTNAGVTWTQTSAQVGYWWFSIASSSDGTKLAAAGSQGGIFTSTNAGVTWTQTSAPIEYWNSIASSSDGSHLAAVVYYPAAGIYTSTNGGVTWTQTSAPSGPWWASIASSSDGTKLAAVVYYGGGIYTSTDAGATWTQTSAPGEGWSSIASSSDGIKLAAAVDGGGIYTSTNGGVTWTQTGAPNEEWYSIASTSDGTQLAAVVNYPIGGIWTAQSMIVPVTGTTFAGIVADGPSGSNYLIQAASNLTDNWTTLTNVALPWGPYFYIDYSSLTNAQQFYRAVPAP
jgi:photosystem II stability/assembly factor-like uncharacterized protein